MNLPNNVGVPKIGADEHHYATIQNLKLADGKTGSDAQSRFDAVGVELVVRSYDLSLPIMIRAAAQGMAETQKGKTRDISTRGLYFVIDQDLRDGSELDIMLTLPREMTNGDEVLVKASGKVVRVEERLEDGSLRRGVAAIIERYDIMRGSPSA